MGSGVAFAEPRARSPVQCSISWRNYRLRCHLREALRWYRVSSLGEMSVGAASDGIQLPARDGEARGSRVRGAVLSCSGGLRHFARRSVWAVTRGCNRLGSSGGRSAQRDGLAASSMIHPWWGDARVCPRAGGSRGCGHRHHTNLHGSSWLSVRHLAARPWRRPREGECAAASPGR